MDASPDRREPSTGRPVRKRGTWLAYLTAGMLVLAAFLFVPGVRVGPLFNAIALSAVAAILLAVRWYRPERRLAWYLIALGQVVFVGGDVITYNYARFFGSEPPFPSIGDALYLSVYPFLIAGLILLVRRRSPGRDRASLIDSCIVGIGVGTVSWVFLIAPYAHDASLRMIEKLVATGYPIMDLALFTVAVRLAVGSGKRSSAFYLMIAAVVVLFVTDSIYGWIVLHGAYDNTTGYLEGGWGMFYLLWGAAALHPSMRQLDEPSAEAEPGHPRRRLLILAAASVVAPLVNIVQSLRGDTIDVPVVSAAGSVIFVLVLVRLNRLMVDVGEYRRTARALREAEAKYRSLVEGLPAVVYIAEFGEDGSWVYISPQIESILGFTPHEFTSASKLWRERIVPEDREEALAAELRVLRGEDRLQCEYRIRSKDGRLLWIREEADAVHDENGQPIYLQGVMYDITELKQAEEQLVRSLEAEKEASARVRALHEMQNSFLQAVSHDLRTPLTNILGHAITLQRDDLDLSDVEARDLIGRVAANARKLHRLVTDLLDLDRISRGVVEPKRDEIDATELVRNVLAETPTNEHPVELVTTTSVHAFVDVAQVERIVENLVSNAIRYTAPGTPVWISVHRHDEGVLLAVEDGGPGVPPELRESIFEPFRQGSQVVGHSPGVGIGLSLVARFAELHGGRAWVEEHPGGGASFKVFLPDGPPTPPPAISAPVTGALRPATTSLPVR
ncbi:MAG: ATP-binding protein [Candidatus Velamenicoccus archaeovorus]